MRQSWITGLKSIGEIKRHGIRRKDVHNFDETGFRVGSPYGIEVIVPIDVKEVRFLLYLKDLDII